MLSMKPGNLACQYPIPKPTRVAGPDPVFLSVISGSSFLEESILLDHDQEKLDPDPTIKKRMGPDISNLITQFFLLSIWSSYFIIALVYRHCPTFYGDEFWRDFRFRCSDPSDKPDPDPDP